MKIEELKKIRFFEGFNDKELEKFLKISHTEDFKVRDILFEQYDELKFLYVLLEGNMSLGISMPNKKRIHLGSIHEGQLFSWSAIFMPHISTAWVMACTPVKVLAIDAAKLKKEIEGECAFGYKFMEKISMTISQRLSDTRFHLMNRLTI